MSAVQFFTKFLFFTFMLVAAISLLFGSNLGGSDLLNTITRSAQARRMDVDTTYQEKLYELDLQRQVAKNIVDQKKAELEIEHLQRKQQIDLLLHELFGYVLLFLAGLAGITLILTTGFIGTRIVLAHLPAEQPVGFVPATPPPYHPAIGKTQQPRDPYIVTKQDPCSAKTPFWDQAGQEHQRERRQKHK